LSGAGQKIAAVVLAAGKGTRMKSEKAKVLHEASGRPLAFFPIRAALALDASPVVVIVGHQAEVVQDVLGRQFAGAPVRFAGQAQQLGTAHAVLCAEEALRGFEGSVLILAADVPLIRVETLQKLIAARQGADVALITCKATDPTGYGRVVRRQADIVEYNRAAIEVANRLHIPVDDLFALVMRTGREKYLKFEGIHFTEEGYELIGSFVSRTIRSLLPAGGANSNRIPKE